MCVFVCVSACVCMCLFVWVCLCGWGVRASVLTCLPACVRVCAPLPRVVTALYFNCRFSLSLCVLNERRVK